jgi:polyribonucleotide 5'-hydroxyl-kinase
MKAYGNLHVALEKMRVRSLFTLTGSSLTPGEPTSNARPSEAPRVLVIGPANSGKTTLCKILVNYCVRAGQGWSPILANIDPGDVRVTSLQLALATDATPKGGLDSSRHIICGCCT